jgi:hypothetical protein
MHHPDAGGRSSTAWAWFYAPRLAGSATKQDRRALPVGMTDVGINALCRDPASDG